MNYLYYFFISFVFAGSITLFINFFRKKKSFCGLSLNYLHEKDKSITSKESLFTALSACLGTGNIVGVGIMIISFGPGTIFWLWVQAFLGLIFKYFEAYFSVLYRQKNTDSENIGGPMFYIEKSFKNKKNGKIFGSIYAVSIIFLSLTVGNMIQTESFTNVLKTNFGVNVFLSSFILAIFVFFIIRGGLKGIVRLLNKLMPFMLALYVFSCILLLSANITKLPLALNLIISDAFSGKALLGGNLFIVIKYGILRGIFTNEAGIGFGAIAHGASNNSIPHKEGKIAALGIVFDTFLMCTLTALIILTSSFIEIKNGEMLISKDITGNIITNLVFIEELKGIGFLIISLSIILFSFASILGWFYYGEVAINYLFKKRNKKIFACIFSSLVFCSAFFGYQILWEINDWVNTFLFFLNVMALLVLTTRRE